MRQFTQEQAAEMYAAARFALKMLEKMTTEDFIKGADKPFREWKQTATANRQRMEAHENVGMPKLR